MFSEEGKSSLRCFGYIFTQHLISYMFSRIFPLRSFIFCLCWFALRNVCENISIIFHSLNMRNLWTRKTSSSQKLHNGKMCINVYGTLHCKVFGDNYHLLTMCFMNEKRYGFIPFKRFNLSHVWDGLRHKLQFGSSTRKIDDQCQKRLCNVWEEN